MFIIFPMLIFSQELYTEIHGGDNNLCHLLSPCSFEKVMTKIQAQDLVFINDKYIGETDELEKLRVLLNFALSKGAVVLSNHI